MQDPTPETRNPQGSPRLMACAAEPARTRSVRVPRGVWQVARSPGESEVFAFLVVPPSGDVRACANSPEPARFAFPASFAREASTARFSNERKAFALSSSPSSATICCMSRRQQEPESITRLLFVRHGQTESNAARRYMGQTDSPLTDLGWRQADAVAQRLAQLPIDALYASDLGRTMATATAISSTCGQPVIPDPRLREQDFGRFEGMTVDELLEAYPEAYAEHRQRTLETAVHGGESSLQVRERVASFIDDILKRHPGKTIVAVAHGGVMAAVLWHLLDTPYETTRRTHTGNTGLGEFRHDQDRWILERWNDKGHLDPSLGHGM